MKRRTDAERQAIAKDAAERVARNTGTPAQLCYAPILWALEDADHGSTAWSSGRMWAECVAIPVVGLLVGLGLVWCYP